jgi:hypothetical protein
MKRRTVEVFKTSTGDWKALFADDPFNFAFGRTGAEAVGNLLIANGDSFHLIVKVQKFCNSPRR